LEGLDDRAMAATWRILDGEREILAMPRVAFLRSVMLNHWYHHRGQLSVYLRQLNVPVPSIYGPSADENPFVQSAAAAARQGASTSVENR
jgi:DinB family.